MRRTASFAQFASEFPPSPGRATASPPLLPTPSSGETSLRRAVSFTTLADLPKLPPAMASHADHLVIKLISSRKAADAPPAAPRLRPTGCADDLDGLEPLSLEPMLLAPSFMLPPTPELRPLEAEAIGMEALTLPPAVLVAHAAGKPARHSPLAARSPCSPRVGLKAGGSAALPVVSLLSQPLISELPSVPPPLIQHMRTDPVAVVAPQAGSV